MLFLPCCVVLCSAQFDSIHLNINSQPEGKDMKQIVHDFALSQEKGALDSRCAVGQMLA